MVVSWARLAGASLRIALLATKHTPPSSHVLPLRAGPRGNRGAIGTGTGRGKPRGKRAGAGSCGREHDATRTGWDSVDDATRAGEPSAAEGTARRDATPDAGENSLALSGLALWNSLFVIYFSGQIDS